jgi:aspartyl aminopeptidase
MSPLLEQTDFNNQLLNFIQASPTAFHASQTMATQLRAAGFNELSEAAAWNLQAGNRFCAAQ